MKLALPDLRRRRGALRCDGDAVQLAVLREKVAHRVVLSGAVVPDGQGAVLPAQAGLEFGHPGQLEQLGQQRIAL